MYSFKGSPTEKKTFTHALTLLNIINLWCWMRQRSPHLQTSAHSVLYSSSTSLRERPSTHCFQSKWVFVHMISSEVGTYSWGGGLCLSHAKHTIILLHWMPALVYFLLPWVEILLSWLLLGWISPSIIILQRDPHSLILRDWHQDMFFQISEIFHVIKPHLCCTGNILTLSPCAH